MTRAMVRLHELRAWGRRPAPLWFVRLVTLTCTALAGGALGMVLARLDLHNPAMVAALVLAWLLGLAAGALGMVALARPWRGGL